jgi:hypothetical protein
VVHYVDGYAEGPKKNIARRDAVRSMLGCLSKFHVPLRLRWREGMADVWVCRAVP